MTSNNSMNKKNEKSYIRKISDIAILGGMSAILIGGLVGCDNSSSSSAQEISRKQGVTVTLQEQRDGSYKILDETPSSDGDTTVIVTASKETKKDNLDRVVKNIQNVGGKIAGIVINKVPISAKKYSETYYYGSTAMNVNGKRKGNKMSSAMKNTENLKRRTTNSIAHNMPDYDYKKEKKYKNDVKNSFNNNSINDNLKNNLNSNTNSNVNSSNNVKKNDSKTMDMPNFIKNNSDVTNNLNNDKSTIAENKANEILGQINSYLEEQKKNLNKN